MEEVFDENIFGSNSNINCIKIYEYIERYKIFVIEMINIVIYLCYNVRLRKLLIN